jgi:tetratricopeptide (TPR) repeat protein
VREGRNDEAVEAINRATGFQDPAPPAWVVEWLSGLASRQEGNFEAARKSFSNILATQLPKRKFDFSLDYEVINELGGTLFDLARQIRDESRKAERDQLLNEAVATFQKTLEIDSENVAAHYNLQLLYQQLGNSELAEQHRELHERYKEDDNIRDRAIRLARERYPAGNHAAEALVIYPLHRVGAPGLPRKGLTADAN